ncbi:MAG: hypothetical protein L0I37_11250 [Lactococcus lactis]|nr:hypothetical protein [Lactococcus lactis]
MNYHVVEAKHQGFSEEWSTFLFPISECPSERDALAKFNEVEKTTNPKYSYNRSNPYTAYEYEGELFYKLNYIGLKTEEEIKEVGIEL